MEQNIKKRQSVMIFFVSLLIWSFLFYKNDTHTHTHTCTHARTHAHAHARACTQTHTRTHTHTYTNIYLCSTLGYEYGPNHKTLQARNMDR